MSESAVVPGSITRRSKKLSGKAFVLFLIGVWVAVIAGVTLMIVIFKRGGVDALRIDQTKQATPAPAAPERSGASEPASR